MCDISAGVKGVHGEWVGSQKGGMPSVVICLVAKGDLMHSSLDSGRESLSHQSSMVVSGMCGVTLGCTLVLVA